jgi:hypothetical protein
MDLPFTMKFGLNNTIEKERQICLYHLIYHSKIDAHSYKRHWLLLLLPSHYLARFLRRLFLPSLFA